MIIHKFTLVINVIITYINYFLVTIVGVIIYNIKSNYKIILFYLRIIKCY